MNQSVFKQENETPEEYAKRIGVPVIPKKIKPKFEPIHIIAVCGECGHGVTSTSSFYCSNRDCPVNGHGAVMSNKQENSASAWPFPGSNRSGVENE